MVGLTATHANCTPGMSNLNSNIETGLPLPQRCAFKKKLSLTEGGEKLGQMREQTKSVAGVLILFIGINVVEYC